MPKLYQFGMMQSAFPDSCASLSASRMNSREHFAPDSNTTLAKKIPAVMASSVFDSIYSDKQPAGEKIKKK